MPGLTNRTAFTLGAALLASIASSTSLLAQQIPAAEQPYKGVLGETPQQSSPPHYAPQPQAPKGAPNVIVIMLDDVGFGALSTFGGPVPTPHLDALAQRGIRYNGFHTTAMCSPTRAALLTGRNQHSVGSGVIGEVATGYPGYNGMIPRSAATFGRVFRGNGYATAWFGKNHNTPIFELTPNGPFDRWPTGLGFDYFYGFMGGETNQWAPTLYENTRPVQGDANDPTYHLDRDLADRAIAWIDGQHTLTPDKPFLLYYAPGTAHSPLDAPTDWIARYKGKFDKGWDAQREETWRRQKREGMIPPDAKLVQRPAQIPAWDSLSADERAVAARQMEVYAAAIGYCDEQIGRLIETLRKNGELDNTMIVFIEGDNGSSAEGGPVGTVDDFYHLNGRHDTLEELKANLDKFGGPDTMTQYASGWGWAMNAPFPWFKQVAGHLGGTRNGLVISWPGRIKPDGKIRSQFTSVIDVAPTLYEAVGITPPTEVDGIAQQPIEGISFAYSFTRPTAPSRHITQYFEIFANRGIYHDGWLASTTPPKMPWEAGRPIAVGDYQWELYNLAKDFSQSRNLATENPEKLAEMKALFLSEARKYNVLPLDNLPARRAPAINRPYVLNGRSEVSFARTDMRYHSASWPDIKNKSWSLSTTITPDSTAPDGMIVGEGGKFSGWGLMVLSGKPVFAYRTSKNAQDLFRIEGPALGAGPHRIDIDFTYDGGGMGKGGTFRMSVDGKDAGQAKLPETISLFFSEEGATIGHDVGTPLTAEYRLPFTFAGRIDPVTFRLQSPPSPERKTGE